MHSYALSTRQTTATKRADAATPAPPASRFFRTLIALAVCASVAVSALFAYLISSRPARSRPTAALQGEASGERADHAFQPGPRVRPAPPLAFPAATSSSAADPAATDVPQPPPPITAREEREQMISDLRATGPSQEPWTGEATKLFQAVGSAIDASGTAEHGKIECFREGCVQTTTFASAADSEASLKVLREYEPFFSWPGVKSRTGSEHLPNGKVANAVFLYRPEAAHNKP